MPLPDRDFARLTASSRLMAMTICDQIREYRLKRNWSQTTLADRIGVRQSSVSEWETGVTMPQLHMLMRICIVLGIPFSFGGKSQT
jgi:transcriptional regulator with XRE-family HTH domain